MAPSCKDFNVTAAPSCEVETTPRSGRGLLDIMISIACNPSICGMLISMLKTSVFRASVWVPASRPSRASPQTSSCGSEATIVVRTRRMNAESSTMSTRVFLPTNVIAVALSPSRHHGAGGLRGGYANQFHHRRDERFFLHRFRHKRHRAFLHSPVAMLGAGPRSHDHYRNATGLLLLVQVGQQFVTVGAWHLQVGDHQIAMHLAYDLQGFQAVGGQTHAIAGLFQHAAHELAHADGVVHHPHASFFINNIGCFLRNRAVRENFRS